MRDGSSKFSASPPVPLKMSWPSLADAHLPDVDVVGLLHHLLFPQAVLLHWRWIAWGWHCAREGLAGHSAGNASGYSRGDRIAFTAGTCRNGKTRQAAAVTLKARTILID